MKPMRYKDLLINFTTEFDLLWNAKNMGATYPGCFWRPNTTSDTLNSYSSLGDVLVGHYRNINDLKIVAVVSEVDKVNGTALRAPIDFQQVWKNAGKKVRAEISIWRPRPPEGYVAMGMVFSVGNEKPSLNSVRCVREDLVSHAYIGSPIWNDKGSRSQMDFSAWDIQTAEAEPGEACIATGTFFGHDSYSKPTFGASPRALRMDLAYLENPLPAPPEPFGTMAEHPPQICELPWFLVKDNSLSILEQLKDSPIYRLERSDRYLEIGIGNNTTAEGKTFKWNTTNGEVGDHSIGFSHLTRINIFSDWSWPLEGELGSEWIWSTAIQPVFFSARLNDAVNHTTQSAKGWGTSSSLEVAAYVPANQTIAAYLIHSEYRLLRKDGTQLGPTVSYVNGDTVYFSELPAPAPATNQVEYMLEPAQEPAAIEEVPAETTLEITPHDAIDDALVP